MIIHHALCISREKTWLTGLKFSLTTPPPYAPPPPPIAPPSRTSHGNIFSHHTGRLAKFGWILTHLKISLEMALTRLLPRAIQFICKALIDNANWSWNSIYTGSLFSCRASELSSSLPPFTSAELLPKTDHTDSQFICEYDKYDLGKAYFDSKEFDRAAVALEGCSSHKAYFVHIYARFMVSSLFILLANCTLGFNEAKCNLWQS